MRIAYITDEIPRPNRAGYLGYNHALISHLAARGHHITLVLGSPRLSGIEERYDTVLDPDRVRVIGRGLTPFHGRIAVAGLKGQARAVARGAMNLLPGPLLERVRRQGRAGDFGLVDAVIGRFLTEREAKGAADLAAGADLVMADAIFRAPALAHLPPGQPTAIITHDVFHARHAALAARGMSLAPASLTEAEEVSFLSLANLLVAIQPEEEAVLRAMVPGARVVTAPMPARPVPRPEGVRREAGRIAFVGTVGPHNVDGMRWFLAEIWPLVAAQLPSARLDVCGSVGRVLGAAPEGVSVLGVVPDLAPVLHRACLAIAPLRAGSGLKIKLLEFASHGLVTVTTGIGAAGFERAPGWPFVLADSAEAFAAEIVRLAATDGLDREAAAWAYLAHYDAPRLLAPFVAAVEGGAVEGSAA